MSNVKTHTKLYTSRTKAVADAAALAGEHRVILGPGHFEDAGDHWTYEVKPFKDTNYHWYIELRDEDGNFIALWGDPLFDGLL